MNFKFFKKMVLMIGVWGIGLGCAVASSTDLPFTSTLDTLKDAILGKAAFDIATILVGITMLMLGFGEWTDGIKRVIQFTFFLSLALSASSAVNALFGASGALC